MTTKKDLVEAHAYSRRRLVTAFLSGAPGGREVEPSRPGRTIFGGLALAVLLVAGAAIASVLAPRTADGWDGQGMVISKETGERYLILGDTKELRPVINVTSAQLLLGMNYKLTVVSQKTLDGRTPGPEIGIVGAPPELPAQSAFIPSGWTACTAEGAGVAVDVSASPPVTALDGAGVVVQSQGATYLIAQGQDGAAHAYPRPSGAVNFQPVFNDTIPGTVDVSPQWLALFDRVDLGFDAGLRVVQTPVGYDVVRGDKVMNVGSFAAHLIAGDAPMGNTLPANSTEDDHLLDHTAFAQWPQQQLTPATSDAVCAQLRATPDAPTSVTLAGAVSGSDAWPATPPTASEQPVVRVDPGRGAFVRLAGPADPALGQTAMIASTGSIYPLSDPKALAQLGLDPAAAPAVTPAWARLFTRGPELSYQYALCVPQAQGTRSC